MKKLKSGVVLFLCLLMVVSAGLVGCGEDNPAETKDPSNTESATTDEVEYYVPDKKYDGKEITILCPQGDPEWPCNDFFEETSSDEPIPNAVFERKTKIEDTFGVKIKVIEGIARNEINSNVMRTHDAGIIEYDIIMATMPYAYTLAQGGYLMEIYEMGEYLDFTHDSWDQSFLSQTSIGGYNYFATGDITTMDNDGTWVMMFNKELATANDIQPSEIYNTVTSGKWTMDKLLEYTSNFYADKDGDGQLSHGDVYGIATTYDFIQGLFYGADGRIITKDSRDDIPTLNFNTERNSSIIDKIIDIYYRSNKITFDCHDYKHINTSVHLISQAMFEEDRALFYSEVMQCAIRLREMETEFGIIPVPKFNAEQKNYTTHVVANTALMACFSSLFDNDREEEHRDMVAMVTQALAVEGKNILTPAYYEKSLMYKGARDDESRAMLPIIFANRVSDLGYMAESGAIATMYNGMRNMIMSGKNQIASLNKTNENLVAKALKRMVADFEID